MALPSFDFKGKRVLVTGGSAGIGKACALAFAKSGAQVAVLGRRQERLDAVVKEMGGGVGVVADLGLAEQVERAVKEAIQKLGGLDVVVNKGGATTEGMSKPGLAAYDEAIALHVKSALAVFEAAKEELLKNKGCVVNISSIAAQIAFPSAFACYSVAKAAQDQLTRSLAFEYAERGVRVNSIQPATIATEAIEGYAKAKGVTLEEALAGMAQFHAMKRCGTPDEIAYPVLFLASPAASFITGATLNIDGGALLAYAANTLGL